LSDRHANFGKTIFVSQTGQFYAILLIEKKKKTTFLVSTLFVVQIFLIYLKEKKVSSVCKVTHMCFLATENVFS